MLVSIGVANGCNGGLWYDVYSYILREGDIPGPTRYGARAVLALSVEVNNKNLMICLQEDGIFGCRTRRAGCLRLCCLYINKET